MNNLTIKELIKEGSIIGFRNSLKILGAFLLWTLTLWIPYINIGTTVAIATISGRIKKNTSTSPFEIFSSKYRQNIGEFLILYHLKSAGLILALSFFIVPYFIVKISWSQALNLFVYKNLSFSKSLKYSSENLKGNIAKIFFSNVLTGVIPIVIIYFVALIFHIDLISLFYGSGEIFDDFYYDFNDFNDLEEANNYFRKILILKDIFSMIIVVIVLSSIIINIGMKAYVYSMIDNKIEN